MDYDKAGELILGFFMVLFITTSLALITLLVVGTYYLTTDKDLLFCFFSYSFKGFGAACGLYYLIKAIKCIGSWIDKW